MVKKIPGNGGWIVVALFIFALAIGCTNIIHTNNQSQSRDFPQGAPETGIQNWINAINQKDIVRLYDLSPDEIKRELTLDQFREENSNNTLLQPGYGFVNYTVVDKKQNGTYAQIFAQVWKQYPPNPQNKLGPEVPVYYTFALFYEHNEWKIWDI
jgi:hypothetical protein